MLSLVLGNYVHPLNQMVTSETFHISHWKIEAKLQFGIFPQ